MTKERVAMLRAVRDSQENEETILVAPSNIRKAVTGSNMHPASVQSPQSCVASLLALLEEEAIKRGLWDPQRAVIGQKSEARQLDDKPDTAINVAETDCVGGPVAPCPGRAPTARML